MRTCSKCHEVKPEEDFTWRNKSKGLRHYYCRACKTNYNKDHYNKNKQYYLEKGKRYRDKLRSEFFTWLDTQECADCGVSDYRLLEFDHVRGEKIAEISTLLMTRSRQAIFDEIAKCDIVCANCHRIRTAERGSYYQYLRGADAGI